MGAGLFRPDRVVKELLTMLLRPRTLATGMLSYLPGAREVYRRHFFHPGATSAMGCYGVWLKHLSLTLSNGMRGIPRTVVELGPGNSIGVGLAALICGADEYHGLDAVPTLERDDTMRLFDELVALFRARATPLNAEGYTRYGDGGFPRDALPSDLLRNLLSVDRLLALRQQVERFMAGRSSALNYAAPWNEQALNRAGRVDFVLSHAVLQHVGSVDEIFASVARLLRPGGFSSHQVSFDSHGITTDWNGHWACPTWAWNLALGRKDFLVNRIPHSRLLTAVRHSGLEVAADLIEEDNGGLDRSALHHDWAWLEDDDLVIRDAFVVVRKPL
jgi:hypothetical protein